MQGIALRRAHEQVHKYAEQEPLQATYTTIITL